MISEICRKVQERVAELEKEEASAEPAAVPSEDNRPALLILAEDHGMRCHPVLESKKLAECYRVECALLKEEDCDVASYEGVIAFTLTNEALGKIANGIFDTDYTRRFGTALLLGKRIFIAEEEVELYRYKDTAPAGYYSRLEENLKFLQQNGVTHCSLRSTGSGCSGRKRSGRNRGCSEERRIHRRKRTASLRINPTAGETHHYRERCDQCTGRKGCLHSGRKEGNSVRSCQRVCEEIWNQHCS